MPVVDAQLARGQAQRGVDDHVGARLVTLGCHVFDWPDGPRCGIDQRHDHEPGPFFEFGDCLDVRPEACGDIRRFGQEPRAAANGHHIAVFDQRVEQGLQPRRGQS